MSDWDYYVDFCANNDTEPTPEGFAEWEIIQDMMADDDAADLAVNQFIYGRDYC